MTRGQGWSVVLGLALALAVLPATASGQYFGRNKVQYRTFDFQVLKTEHFDLYYYPEEAEAAAIVGRMAERWNDRLSRFFGHELRGRQPLILYAVASHFRQTNAVEGLIGEGTGGVTEALKRRVVLPMGGSTIREVGSVAVTGRLPVSVSTRRRTRAPLTGMSSAGTSSADVTSKGCSREISHQADRRSPERGNHAVRTSSSTAFQGPSDATIETAVASPREDDARIATPPGWLAAAWGWLGATV